MTLTELMDRWMERLEIAKEMGDSRGARMCELVLEDLNNVDGEPGDQGYWTTAEAANYTGLSAETIRGHCKAGNAGPFPGAVKRDGRWLVPAREVVAYMREDGDASVGGGKAKDPVPVFGSTDEAGR